MRNLGKVGDEENKEEEAGNIKSLYSCCVLLIDSWKKISRKEKRWINDEVDRTWWKWKAEDEKMENYVGNVIPFILYLCKKYIEL